MRRALARRAEVARLAARDYGHEWVMSLCLVLALAAVLAPLLVLLGLKHGVVSGLLEPLREDPRNREIRLVGSQRLPPQWFEQMRRRPEVAFVLPRTRAIAATLRLRHGEAGSGRLVEAELIPSAPGDPLLRAALPRPAGYEQVVLSASAAQRLEAGPGARLEGVLARVRQGSRETVSLPLRVAGVARPAAFAREALFVSVELLSAVEDFRDGRAVPALGWSGAAPRGGKRRFADFRLYTRGIDEVGPLSRELRDQGLEVRTRAADIELVRGLDRSLSLVLGIIAAVALAGYCLSLGASLWANADRKRHELSVLRLVGFVTAEIRWFPVTQALLTGAGGWALASLAYLAVEGGINAVFMPALGTERPVCELLPAHFAGALALTLAASVAAAAVAGGRVARLEAAAGLRAR